MLARGHDLAHGGNLDTVWSLALDRLRTQAPAAVALLDLCAHLSPEPIPLALVRDHPDRLDPPLRDTVAGTSPAGDLDDTGYGGIAYRHIADAYTALFSRFIPCGVWEAVFIFEGLLENSSEVVTPEEIHADTQGQSLPAFGLAVMLGVELLPRIRNWKDLIFYRPHKTTRYTHIEALFGDDAIDWKLIRNAFPGPHAGRDLDPGGAGLLHAAAAPAASGSRRNATYRAFREVGRVIGTVQLLRFLSDPALRARVTAATNKVEAFHRFAQWLQFANRVIADNDPEEQEKVMKFNALLANCVVFHTTLDLMTVVRELQAEGEKVDPEDLSEISPYLTEPIERFGAYSTDELTVPPDAYDAHLDVDFQAIGSAA